MNRTLSGEEHMFLGSSATWREVQVSLDYHLNLHAGQSGYVRGLAAGIAARMTSMDSVLGALCDQTCSGCGDVCCVHATVRYDFRDLVFLHLIGKGLPMGQPAPWAGKACSCLGENGCMIDRLLRPFMCTWYLCPGQMELVRSTSLRGYCLQERFREIQNDRKELESEFLKLVDPYGS